MTEISIGMTEIARASRDHRPVPAWLFASMTDAAAKEPLASEPFLARALRAESASDGAIAQRAFEAAQWRDPRSLPAAYFLAGRYFTIGDTTRALREIATLAHLSPSGPQTVDPYLAAYARNPANWPRLRALFRSNPLLAASALVSLASNVETAPTVITLTDPRNGPGEGHWLEPLLNTLIQAGQYAQARAVWAKAAGVQVQPGELLHDSTFSDRSSPSPFNWLLTPSPTGLAERQAGGRLRVIFYGREDGFLANQLLLLAPGSYRLSMQLLGDPTRARELSWSVWCHKATEAIAAGTLDAVATRGLRFKVPRRCPAQWIKLAGSSSNVPEQVDVTVAALKLERVGPGA